MTHLFTRLRLLVLRAAAAAATAGLVAACGGGVSANPSPIVDSPTLTILPATATLYSGLPTTFVLSGGTGAYIVTSDNQAIVPVSGGVTGRSVTVVPNPVTVDTTVTLTLRDTGSATPVTATLTVKPGTVNNDVQITPNPLQDASCSPGLCSGGDADVRATISQGGIPLAARGIRFEVVAGDFRFIVTPAGTAPEQTATSALVATDETGIARTRIRATALAPNQTALVKVTDVVSGAYRLASFVIAQYNGNTPAFFTLPAAVTLSGVSTAVCSNGSADVAVFGGTPPYAVSGTSPAFAVTVNGVSAPPAVVASSGGKFTISFFNSSACVENLPIAVTDATGRTLTVTVTNKLGTVAPAITLVPNQFALKCGQSLSLSVVGGTAPFSAATSDPLLTASLTDRTVTVSMVNATSAGAVTRTATVTVTDGATAGIAAGGISCP